MTATLTHAAAPLAVPATALDLERFLPAALEAAVEQGRLQGTRANWWRAPRANARRWHVVDSCRELLDRWGQRRSGVWLLKDAAGPTMPNTVCLTCERLVRRDDRFSEVRLAIDTALLRMAVARIRDLRRARTVPNVHTWTSDVPALIDKLARAARGTSDVAHGLSWARDTLAGELTALKAYERERSRPRTDVVLGKIAVLNTGRAQTGREGTPADPGEHRSALRPDRSPTKVRDLWAELTRHDPDRRWSFDDAVADAAAAVRDQIVIWQPDIEALPDPLQLRPEDFADVASWLQAEGRAFAQRAVDRTVQFWTDEASAERARCAGLPHLEVTVHGYTLPGHSDWGSDGQTLAVDLMDVFVPEACAGRWRVVAPVTAAELLLTTTWCRDAKVTVRVDPASTDPDLERTLSLALEMWEQGRHPDLPHLSVAWVSASDVLSAGA